MKKETGFHRVDARLAAYDGAVARMKMEFERLPGDPSDKAWVKRKLAHMAEIDEHMRGHVLAPAGEKYPVDEDNYYWERFGPRFQSIDAANTGDLKRLLELHGWFKISEWGEESDDAAWLIAQHADEDAAFQIEVLAKLEALYPIGETNPRNYAYLYDRVAVAEGRLQRYGTQGRCAGPGRWEPEPMEDPEHVDERRKAMGLGTSAENKERLADVCR